MEGTSALIKVLIKLHNDQDNTNKWVHLCYIPKELYDVYTTTKSQEFINLNETLSRWAKEDFEEEFSIITAEDLDKLKSLIKEFCKNTYPDVYLEQSTDRQGWLRVWISKKMKEDLGINGE